MKFIFWDKQLKRFNLTLKRQYLFLIGSCLVVFLCVSISLIATMTAALSNIGTLSSLLPLPSITNKPPPVPAQPNIAALEEVKRKVAKQANSISIKEFTDVSLHSLYYTYYT